MSVEKTTKKPLEMDFGKKILVTLFGILLAYGIVLFGTMIRNNIQTYRYIGRAPRPEHTLVVEAEGKVTAVPDVAVVTMGVIAKGTTVAEAQNQSTVIMNSLTEKVKALGVLPADIQTTNYNVYPKITYSPTEGEKADGFEVNQTVTIKIRELSKAGEVLALAGTVGANSVGGVDFRIDDPEVFRRQARALALQKVREKARQLTAALGVRVADVVSYSEFEGGSGPILYAAERGFGGGLSAPVPGIEAGTNEVVMHVNVVFEIE